MFGSAKVECSTCGKKFSKNSNLYRHQRTIHGNSKPYDVKLCEPIINDSKTDLKISPIKYECSICSKTFTKCKNLKRHTETIHGNPKLFDCKQCDYKTTRTGNLKRHEKRKHTSKKLTEPEIVPTKKKRNIKPMLDIAGLPSPEQPFAVEYFSQLTDEGYTREAIECLSESWEYVRTKYTYGKLRKQYNIRLKTEELDVAELTELLMKIHELQPNAYKINIGWGRLLQHIETEEWRYFYPLANAQRYWNVPIAIKNPDELLKAIEFMDSQDITDHLTIQRPDTKYILKRVVNFNVVVYLLKDFPLMGDNSPLLPPHILQHRFIKTLQKDTNGNTYKDPMCAFRCISYHLHHGTELQAKARELAEQFSKFAKIPVDKFTGEIKMDQLFQLELCFKLKICVYSLVPKIDSDHVQPAMIAPKPIKNFEARLIRCSPIKKSNAENGELNLDLSEGHLSVITSLDNYAHTFACNHCNKLFKIRSKCKLHQATCLKTSQNRARYVGGAYKCSENNVFKNLEEFGIKINHEHIFCQFFSVFDFETINAILSDDDPRRRLGQNLTFERILELCSCSVNSSVPGFCQPKFIRRYTTESEFTKQFVDYLCDIAKKSEILLKEKLQYVFEQVNEKMTEFEAKINETIDDQDVQDYYKCVLRKLKRHHTELESYTKSHVVYAWNGSRFDMKVARKSLIEELYRRDMPVKSVIKRQSAYSLLATESLVFKDAASLVAPGTSLENFLLSFGLPVQKWSFPYDYITSLSKLNETQLPPYKEFWNSLKGNFLVTRDEYDEIAEWYSLNAKCLWDYLEEYNNRDVDSMIPGLEKLREFWKSYDIDMITGGISLSSLSSQLMFKLKPDDKPFVWLPRTENRWVYDLAVESIVGGPALVWKRYAEKDKSKIRDGPAICKSIMGLDANALYLYCLGQELPTSFPVTWNFNVKTEKYHRKDLIPPWTSVGEIEYCFCVQHFTKDKDLRHVYNNNGQVSFGKKKYKPDAYSVRDKRLNHYMGCYWHFCKNCIVGQRRTANEPTKAAERHEEDRKMIEYFHKLGLKQEIMTECQWNNIKQTDKEIKSFIENKLSMSLSNYSSLSKTEILEKIRKGELFGFARVSLEVPVDKYDKFKEFCPIFRNRVITRQDLSSYQQIIAEENGLLKHGRKSLISVMKAERIVLITPLIKWYMDHGLEITEVFEVVQFKGSKILTEFTENVTFHRKQADSDQSKKQLGDMHKTAGNAAYGKTLQNSSMFTTTKFADEITASGLVNRKEFIDLESVFDDFYEITMAKRQYKEKVPRIIGAFVLGLAKKRLLEMYYDFLDKYFDRSTWELICADTDSLYMAIAAENLSDFEKLVPSNKFAEYKKERDLFLTTDKATLREPGLFKLEYSGTGVVSLSPKVYCVWNDDTGTNKISCKGINQRHLLEKHKYLEVLKTQNDVYLENVGFRYKDGDMLQYRQKKKGLSYFFVKRKLNDDGVTTEPIVF